MFLQPEAQNLFGFGIGYAGPEKFFVSLSDLGAEAYACAPIIRKAAPNRATFSGFGFSRM